MKSISILTALTCIFLAGCKTSNRNPERNEISKTSISLPTVRAMLNTELLCKDVQDKFGPPLIQHEGNWGNMIYKAPDDTFLVFFYKGPYVTGARYGSMEIEGIAPKTRSMRVGFDLKEKQYHFYIDGIRFRDYDTLTEHLEKHPIPAILEYQSSCIIFDGSIKPPLNSSEEIAQFEALCRKLGIIWIRYPAG